MTRVRVVGLVSYGLVMGVGTGLDVVTVSLLRHLSVVPLVVAVGAGFLANVGTGYVLSRVLVFPAARHSHRTAGPRYLALVAVNVLVAILGVAFLVARGLPYLVARVLSSAVLVPTNYVVMRSWVFAEA